MNDRDDFNRYLTILLLSAPTAVAIFFIFHGIYVSLSQAEEVAGYVDSSTQVGIYLGYAVMVGGTLIFGILAAWAAVRLAGVVRRSRKP